MRLVITALALLTACGSRPNTPDASLADSGPPDGGALDGGSCDAGVAPHFDCTDAGTCPAFNVSGDIPDGSFQYGLADPSLFEDPLVPGRLWLGYSHPEGKAAPNPDGGAAVGVYTVENHLARSDDDGASWTFASALFPATVQTDPVGGTRGFVNSESCGLLGVADAGITTWYSVRIAYFLQSKPGFNPDYVRSWTLRVGAATGATPQALSSASEAVLGETNTSAAWNVDVRLNSLSPALARCFVFNNPALAYENGKLYLITECLVLAAMGANDAVNSFIVVFSTSARGPPPTWSWSYVGSLADHALATELGASMFVSPNVSRGSDGKLLLIATPADVNPSVPSGSEGNGCVVLELDALDPPTVSRDCAGNAVVRARMTGPAGSGSCTHHRNSTSGVIWTGQPTPSHYVLHRSTLFP